MTREPIVWTVAAGVLASAVLRFLASTLLTVTPDTEKQFNDLITLAVAIIGGFIARSKVTPSSDPRDANGVPLA